MAHATQIVPSHFALRLIGSYHTRFDLIVLRMFLEDWILLGRVALGA